MWNWQRVRFALIFLLAGIGMVVGPIVVLVFLRPHKPSATKLMPYECGMEPVGDARVRLSIHYYLVAVLFIVFDVEALFLILWATSAREFAAAGVGLPVFCAVAAFVLVLALTLVYEWRKGGLEWDR